MFKVDIFSPQEVSWMPLKFLDFYFDEIGLPMQWQTREEKVDCLFYSYDKMFFEVVCENLDKVMEKNKNSFLLKGEGNDPSPDRA
jgi:hypothetical protein